MKDLSSIEYLKSRFRCPICGVLAGCTEEGNIGLMSVKIFNKHIEECREKSRVKPGRIRHTEDEN